MISQPKQTCTNKNAKATATALNAIIFCCLSLQGDLSSRLWNWTNETTLIRIEVKDKHESYALLTYIALIDRYYLFTCWVFGSPKVDLTLKDLRGSPKRGLLLQSQFKVLGKVLENRQIDENLWRRYFCFLTIWQSSQLSIAAVIPVPNSKQSMQAGSCQSRKEKPWKVVVVVRRNFIKVFFLCRCNKV